MDLKMLKIFWVLYTTKQGSILIKGSRDHLKEKKYLSVKITFLLFFFYLINQKKGIF